jgi:hypothetical protein
LIAERIDPMKKRRSRGALPQEILRNTGHSKNIWEGCEENREQDDAKEPNSI